MATKALRKLTYVPAFIVSLKYYQQHQNNAKQYCFLLNSSYVSKGTNNHWNGNFVYICYNKNPKTSTLTDCTDMQKIHLLST